MEGLLLAHDRIASTTDRSPASFLHSSTDAFTNKIHNQSANIINNNVLKVSYDKRRCFLVRDSGCLINISSFSTQNSLITYSKENQLVLQCFGIPTPLG